MMHPHDILKLAAEIAKAYAGSPTKQNMTTEQVLEAVYKKLKELNED
ncbi:MAG: hypothetical protein PHU49_07985 [Syntrophorhabdaceae bacterium]|nr:hypothetical protein [Syntrophorhabdaceae bacterium]MDD5243943.1 hypothetical protein [Syntrophorhabdaceae bacterium]